MKTKQKDMLLTSTSLPPVTLVLAEAKGGVGKSIIAHVSQLALRDDHPNVRVIDTDVNNSTQRMISDAVSLDLARKNFEGELLAVVNQQAAGHVRHVVFDLAAGQEHLMRELAPEMAEAVTAQDGMFVAVRPVTACGFVADNIKTFAEHVLTADMRLLLVKNLARVDDREDFARWDGSKLRASLIERGAVEIEIENAGVALNDRMIQYRLSFDALAHARFDESPYADRARQKFTEADQLSAARWLRRQKATIRAGLERLAAS